MRTPRSILRKAGLALLSSALVSLLGCSGATPEATTQGASRSEIVVAPSLGPASETPAACAHNADCVPEGCCHPRSCGLASQVPACGAVACTMDCKPGTLDCGNGQCACQDGKCGVEWTTP